MKLTIAITFWDKDQKNIKNLLKNIKENVLVEHEVIIIDNRNDTTTKLDFNVDYSFGYNARQFKARKKALELAKGEFIWFVDGDDEVLGLDSISDHDIQVYQYTVDIFKTVEFKEEEIKDFKNTETFVKSLVPLWNKIFRKSLFDNFPYECDIINSEDTIYNLYAIKNAKSYKRFSKTIYHQNIGFSNKNTIEEISDIENIFYGSKESIQIIKELCDDTLDFNVIENIIFKYLMAFINKSKTFEVAKSVLNHLFELFDEERIHKYFIDFSYGFGFYDNVFTKLYEYLETEYNQFDWGKYYHIKMVMTDGSIKYKDELAIPQQHVE